MASDREKYQTERTLGMIIAAVFIALALWPLFTGGSVWIGPLIVGTFFFALANLAPHALHPLRQFIDRFRG